MTEKLRGIFVRWTEARAAWNGLPNDASDDARTKCRETLVAVDTELADALKVEPIHTPTETEGTDAEAREKQQIRAKARLGDWFRAAIVGKAVDGASAEYGAAEGCIDGSMPIGLLEPVEKRVITPAPATQAITMSATLPALFDMSVAPFLGIDMPTVPVGTPAYPYLSTGVTAGMKAKGAAADETAGAFMVSTAEPKRLTGSFRIAKEDIVKLSDLESSLRSNLSSQMADKFDDQVLNGSGAGANLNGLLNQLTDPAAPGTGAETFDRYAIAFASHIDGLHATGMSGVRALIGVQTFVHMASLFRGSDGPISAASYIMREYGGIRSSRRITAPAANIQQAVVRRGNEPGIVRAPVWMGVEFIRDPYSEAGKGEVVITATSMIGGLAITRMSAFVQDSFRLAV